MASPNVPRQVAAEIVTVAALSDALDAEGLREQVMDQRIRPIAAGAPIVGPAFTIRAVRSEVFAERPYEKELAATDAIPDGAVVVFDTDGTMDVGIWGELLSTRAIARGAVGAVIDGGVRDLAGIDRLGFPTYASAIHPADSYGRADVVAFDEPIVCGGVTVRPGDLIAADIDGVVVVPADKAEACMAAALDKLARESDAQEMLRGGASATDTYGRHKVL
ncbi:MAG TPA: RraA family protein [Thermoleophilaceae bacterium]|jgi:4-hydroxy-4-methyl-2-oxoglutarate aldolase|nr:RraA family protein [Thermoleophilaceae bacterium]